MDAIRPNLSARPCWGECQVYSCVSDPDVEYCGVCDEFPCDLLMNYYDPGNPEGPRNAAIRVAVNAYRTKRARMRDVTIARAYMY
jgi:hypothetical protein